MASERMIRTAFTRLAGIEAPIVQAPIAVAPALSAAVANAGGLGLIPMTWLDPDSIRAAVARTRELTDRPVGVNVVLDAP